MMRSLDHTYRTLSVSGFIRQRLPDNAYAAHSATIEICALFVYGVAFHIKFSEEFRSRKDLQLSADNHCITKTRDEADPRCTCAWTIGDIEPVKTGIHCWRVLINNPTQEYLKIGVSAKRMFSDSNLNHASVWGIARHHRKQQNYYKPMRNPHHNHIDLAHFMQTQCAVDILLDADTGTLNMAVVGMADDEHEAKMWNLPTGRKCTGWVPHFIIGTRATDTSLQLLSMDARWYGCSLRPPANVLHVYHEWRRVHPSQAVSAAALQSYLEFLVTQYDIVHDQTTSYSDGTYTVHCIGIRKPPRAQMGAEMRPFALASGRRLYRKIDTTQMATIATNLTGSDTVAALKMKIKQAYAIPDHCDLVIVYGDTIISEHGQRRLKQVGLTSNSLLLCAVTPSDATLNHSNARSRAPLAMDNMYEWRSPMVQRKGFDVIMQEDNVDVVEMPQCGHFMNTASLYDYALHTFDDSSQVCLKCPHPPPPEEKTDEWACTYCTFLNDLSRARCDMCDNVRVRPPARTKCDQPWQYPVVKAILEKNSDGAVRDAACINTMKLELLLSRNVVQAGGHVQRCPQCHTLHFKQQQVALDEIKTVSDVHRHFKHACLLCQGHVGDNSMLAAEARSQWQVCSKLEVYCASSGKWYTGHVTRVRCQNGRDWLQVKYGGNGRVCTRELLREDMWLRPLHESVKAVKDSVTTHKVQWQAGEECEFEVTFLSKRSWLPGEVLWTAKDAETGRELVCVRMDQLTRTIDVARNPHAIRPLGAVAAQASKVRVMNRFHFCWACGKPFDDRHMCDNSFKLELVGILAKSETKTIGSVSNVPAVRCCPNCCQLILHTDACKHMDCKSCKKSFCFVCLKGKKSNGEWQCGSHSSVCPVAPRQDMRSLPDSLVINKKAFQLY